VSDHSSVPGDCGLAPIADHRELGLPGERDALEVLIGVEVELLVGPGGSEHDLLIVDDSPVVGLGVSPPELASRGQGEDA
jgi:hypothetical protein